MVSVFLSNLFPCAYILNFATRIFCQYRELPENQLKLKFILHTVILFRQSGTWKIFGSLAVYLFFLWVQQTLKILPFSQTATAMVRTNIIFLLQ